MLRLKWMVQFANSQNVTWDYTPIGYWSTLEVHVGIVIACLPALRSLQHRLLPSTRSPNSYYPQPSSGYGYGSKGGSVFPSISKHKKGHVDLMTAASQASIMRSRDRNKDDKEFIQLDEYEIRLGDDVSDMNKGGYFRGVNDTQVERGSIHTDDAVLLPIQGNSPPDPTVLSAPTYQKGCPPNHRSPMATLPHAITVRKDYSVTVEMSPEQLSPSPPRVSEDEQSLRRGRSRSSQSPTRGVAHKSGRSRSLLRDGR